MCSDSFDAASGVKRSFKVVESERLRVRGAAITGGEVEARGCICICCKRLPK